MYAIQAKILQFLTIGIQFLCLVLGSMCAHGDRRWNENVWDVDRVELMRLKYKFRKPFNFEEELLIEKNLDREVTIQVVALVLFAILIVVSLIHCYLCFILTFLFYRKYINVYFHVVGALVLLTAFVFYVISFAFNDYVYAVHTAVLYERKPRSKIPSNPCKFPSRSSGFIQLFTGAPYACQESYTKFFVILLTFTNFLLYLSAAFVVSFFVEEEDAAEMLYKQMEIVDGGPLTSLDKLPPLPYYARPLDDSPTTKRGHKCHLPPNFIRVEVGEDGTSASPTKSRRLPDDGSDVHRNHTATSSVFSPWAELPSNAVEATAQRGRDTTY